MAKLLDCEPIGSVEIVDPSLIVEVDLAPVYLVMGDVQLPAIKGTWTLTGGFASVYVTGVQFQYQPLDESTPSTVTASQPKASLAWVTTDGIVPARQYAVSYRAVANSVVGPWSTPETITAGSDMLVTDVSPTSPTNLANLDRLLDEALARFTADMNEEESREAAVTDTQRFIDRIGVVDPATGVVDMRDTARQIMVGAGSMHEAVDRVDTGLSADGAIRRPVPREVAFTSGIHPEQTQITDAGELVYDGGDGPVNLGHVVRVQEATGFLGPGAFIRRDASDANLGGRMFFQKPLINTTGVGDLAIDYYQSLIRIFDAATLYGVTLPLSAFQPSIGGRIVVSTPSGIVTGDLGSTTALRAPAARIGNASGIGYLTLVEGDATYSGRAEFFNSSGGRLGFVGLGNSTTLIMSAETGVNWAFDKRVDMLAGAAVTGALTVSGLATLSGGAAVTGDVTTSGALHAASFVRVRSGSGGYIQHSAGDASNTGYTEFYSAAGTRLGYLGYGSGSTLVMAAEGAVTWAFDKQLRMLGGAAVSGDLSVTANARFGGTNAGSVGSVQFTASPDSPVSNRLTYGTDGSGWQFRIGKNTAGTVVDQVWLADNGHFGIGIAPTTRLHASGGGVLVNTAGGAGNSLGRHINLGSIATPTDWRAYSGNATAAIQMENSSTEGFVLVATQGASVPRTQLITTGGFQLSVGASIGGGGTNAIQVLSDGKVGINTSTPIAPVSVLGYAGYIGQFTDGTRDLRFYTASGYGALGSERVGDDFRLYVDGSATRGLTIKTGTGLTTMSGGAAIAGSTNSVPGIFVTPVGSDAIILQTGSGLAYGWKWTQDEVTTGDMFLKRRLASVDSTVLAFQRSTGNIGIGGTTNPLAPLQVTGDGSLAGADITTNSFTGGSSGSRLRLRHDASSGNAAAIIENLTVGGTTVGSLLLNPSGGSVGMGGDLYVKGGNAGYSGYITANSGTGGLFIAAEGGANETIRLVPKGTGYVWVTSGLLVGGPILRGSADHVFGVDAGQGWRLQNAGVDTFLFEASGRLSLNHLTMGGLGLGEWTTWSPTPVAESGTATGLAMAWAEVERHGKSVTVNIGLSQTAIGTGAAAILVPLPYAAKASRNFFGMGKNLNTGSDLRVEAVGSNLRITAANSYPFGSGAESLAGSITYQCA